MSSALKFALILLAAVILAVGARAAFKARTEPDVKATAPADVMVRVAAVDLPAGLLVRESDLEWKAYPANNVPKDALQQGSAQADLNGALIRRKVAQGTVLKTADFMRSDAPGFLAAVLKPGLRAVSVPIDDVSGNAGLIQPGDAVDLILTQRLSRNTDNENRSSNSVVSETVVENARVIAVGSSFQTQASGDFKPVRARTVTLEVDPKAAEAVTVAAELGTLSLALRSFALERGNHTAATESDNAAVVAWQEEKTSKPVWGEDVSSALHTVRSGTYRPELRSPNPEGDATDDASGSMTPHKIVIMRGATTEEKSFVR